MDKPRIALIESDDLIRQLASRWLRAQGCAVVGTSVQRLRPGQRLHLIMADVAQPRHAAALVRALRAAHAAPILLVSARFHHSHEPSREIAAQLGVAAVLAKPYNAEELQRAVAAALGQPGA